jgi:hypothetical protein
LEQSLVPFTSGGIEPVQLITTFWPVVDGTVILLVAGFDASTVLNNRNCASGITIAPTMEQQIATKTDLSDQRRRLDDFRDIRFFLSTSPRLDWRSYCISRWLWSLEVVEKNLSRSGNLRMSPRITKTEMKSQEFSGRIVCSRE